MKNNIKIDLQYDGRIWGRGAVVSTEMKTSISLKFGIFLEQLRIHCGLKKKYLHHHHHHHHHHIHHGLDQFDPFRLQSYNCSRQRFFGLPVVLLPCGLQRYDFNGIRFCGILCKCKCQFSLYSSTLSSMAAIFSSRRIKSFVLWS